ncbi:hypothetical protein [Proteiniclasticum sp. QWL-01]|uniref:hypothetical protein n=1 Tax=Proteiniclasticum sp. QWL-01 TaxID=3036945 RepID=UPI0024103B76|nr:hypothetical protein [Proteiniclasticum sp. QWL-01]WFF72675.1 hypothetical protein P6M73_15605 [Proteiniclasticum sp. QWL-01]
MIKVKSNVVLNDAAIAKITGGTEKAMKILLEGLKTDVSERKVVPFRDGLLKDSVSTGTMMQNGYTLGWIGWDTPYARRLYFHPEYNFRQDKHRNAMGLWMSFYELGPGQDWIQKSFAVALKIAAGGVIR